LLGERENGGKVNPKSAGTAHKVTQAVEKALEKDLDVRLRYMM
jgi:hypothetical protein